MPSIPTGSTTGLEHIGAGVQNILHAFTELIQAVTYLIEMLNSTVKPANTLAAT